MEFGVVSAAVRNAPEPAERVTAGAPGRIRTCDLKIRSLLLYPAELRAHARREKVERETGFEPATLSLEG
jgi:hypothetical protein